VVQFNEKRFYAHINMQMKYDRNLDTTGTDAVVKVVRSTNLHT